LSDDVPRYDAFKEVFEETIFEQLISVTRAKDSALEYYKNELKKQKASEDDFRRFAKTYADIVVEKYKETTNEDIAALSPEEKKEIISKSLEDAWNKYNS